MSDSRIRSISRGVEGGWPYVEVAFELPVTTVTDIRQSGPTTRPAAAPSARHVPTGEEIARAREILNDLPSRAAWDRGNLIVALAVAGIGIVWMAVGIALAIIL